MGKVIFDSTAKVCENRTFKCFLHILWEAEIHTIPKTQNMGTVNLLCTGKLRKNTNIPKYFLHIGALLYFAWNRNPCNSENMGIWINPYNFQNMGKVNSYSKWKIWENTSISKSRVFLNFSFEAEVYAVPKTWEKGISIVREKHSKTQIFQIYGFLKYFRWNRNHAIPKTY